MPVVLSDDPRSATNPLFNRNKLKLGVFSSNGGGHVMTRVPEQYQPTWPNALDVAVQADTAGFEALVPYARWRPFVHPQHRSGRVFETLTWAAAIAARTSYSAVMSTCHVPLMHPVLAAKAGATIDHVSNGRFALNIVCGWYKPEIEMFGAEQMGHAERYDYADAWITAVKRLWTEEEAFDFDSHDIHIKGGVSQPKPIQKPYPALMNAGGSERGQRFVARHCEVAFIPGISHEDEHIKARTDAYRKLAYEQSGREIQIWCNCYVVQRDTYEDALKYVDYYAEEQGDDEFADNFIAESLTNAKTRTPEQYKALRRHVKAGKGGVPLLGTPESIVDRLERVSKAGIDGVLLLMVDFQNGLRQFNKEVLPLLEQSPLRGMGRLSQAAE